MKIKVHGIELDSFTAQFLRTALWAETVFLPCAESQLIDGCMEVDDDHPLAGIPECEPLEDYFDLHDFTEESLRTALAECTHFCVANGDDLIDEDAEQTGHDFWLTRNRHGAGFWDGDYEDGKGQRLTDSCHNYREMTVGINDDGSLDLHTM